MGMVERGYMNTNRQKNIWIAVGAVVGIVIIVTASYFLWTKVQEQITPQKTFTVSEKADQAKQAGMKAEADGKNEQALENYQTALGDYRKAGDQAAAEDMGYKVEFMKQAIAADKKATEKAIQNGDIPYNEE